MQNATEAKQSNLDQDAQGSKAEALNKSSISAAQRILGPLVQDSSCSGSTPSAFSSIPSFHFAPKSHNQSIARPHQTKKRIEGLALGSRIVESRSDLGFRLKETYRRFSEDSNFASVVAAFIDAAPKVETLCFHYSAELARWNLLIDLLVMVVEAIEDNVLQVETLRNNLKLAIFGPSFDEEKSTYGSKLIMQLRDSVDRLTIRGKEIAKHIFKVEASTDEKDVKETEGKAEIKKGSTTNEVLLTISNLLIPDAALRETLFREFNKKSFALLEEKFSKSHSTVTFTKEDLERLADPRGAVFRWGKFEEVYILSPSAASNICSACRIQGTPIDKTEQKASRSSPADILKSVVQSIEANKETKASRGKKSLLDQMTNALKKMARDRWDRIVYPTIGLGIQDKIRKILHDAAMFCCMQYGAEEAIYQLLLHMQVFGPFTIQLHDGKLRNQIMKFAMNSLVPALGGTPIKYHDIQTLDASADNTDEEKKLDVNVSPTLAPVPSAIEAKLDALQQQLQQVQLLLLQQTASISTSSKSPDAPKGQQFNVEHKIFPVSSKIVPAKTGKNLSGSAPSSPVITASQERNNQQQGPIRRKSVGDKCNNSKGDKKKNEKESARVNSFSSLAMSPYMMLPIPLSIRTHFTQVNIHATTQAIDNERFDQCSYASTDTEEDIGCQTNPASPPCLSGDEDKLGSVSSQLKTNETNTDAKEEFKVSIFFDKIGPWKHAIEFLVHHGQEFAPAKCSFRFNNIDLENAITNVISEIQKWFAITESTQLKPFNFNMSGTDYKINCQVDKDDPITEQREKLLFCIAALAIYREKLKRSAAITSAFSKHFELFAAQNDPISARDKGEEKRRKQEESKAARSVSSIIFDYFYVSPDNLNLSNTLKPTILEIPEDILSGVDFKDQKYDQARRKAAETKIPLYPI